MTAEEFNKCVDLYSDRIYRFVLKSIQDDDLAKDIVQETFIKVWERRDQVVMLTAKSYLFTAAYRTMIDHIRKKKSTFNIDQVFTDAPSVEQPASDLREILEYAADRLPAIQKTVLMLRDYEGYKYEEIASITGLSLEQVKVYLFRARKFLKNYLVSMEVVL
ncbi:MAG: RNA polymerase sigma factor [Bacteroidota bacterium]